MCIRGEIADFLSNSYLKRRKTLDYGESLNIVSRSEDVRIADAADAMERLLSRLPDKYRDLCNLIYKMGMNPGEAGVALGYSKFHGNKMHEWALGNLRKQMAS